MADAESQQKYSPADTATLLKENLDPDRLSDFIDRHIHIFRQLPYAVGLVGCIVLFRSIRLVSKFSKVNQIPQSFIRKNVKLRGKIEDVNMDGTLDVQHRPIVQMPWHNLFKKPPLNLNLASITPTISGIYWMRLNIKGKPIKFQLIDRNVERNKLWTIVELKLPDSKLSLNETLVRRGLAKVDSEEKISLTKIQAKLLASLKSNQVKAMNEGAGLWSLNHKPSWLEASRKSIGGLFSKRKTK